MSYLIDVHSYQLLKTKLSHIQDAKLNVLGKNIKQTILGGNPVSDFQLSQLYFSALANDVY